MSYPALKNAGFSGARQKTIWFTVMGQLQTQTTFNGEAFEAISIPGKKQEGFNPRRNLYINNDQNKIVVVSESGDVLTSITSADGSALKIENL